MGVRAVKPHRFHDAENATSTTPGAILEISPGSPQQARSIGVRVTALGTNAVITPKGSIDKVNFFGIRAKQLDDGSFDTVLLLDKLYVIDGSGLAAVIMELSAQTALSTTVEGLATLGSPSG